jgi:hypothetical protein
MAKMKEYFGEQLASESGFFSSNFSSKSSTNEQCLDYIFEIV